MTQKRRRYRPCTCISHFDSFLQPRSHLPTRLPWENSFAVPNPACHMFGMWCCHLKGCKTHPPCMLATPCWWGPKGWNSRPWLLIVPMRDVLATPGWCYRVSPCFYCCSLLCAASLNDKGGREERPWERTWHFFALTTTWTDQLWGYVKDRLHLTINFQFSLQTYLHRSPIIPNFI